MSIITAITLLPVNLVKTVCSDENFSAKLIYSDYYDSAEKFCEIPGLETSFVPQGMCVSDFLGRILVCGYMEDGTSSRIYVINPQNGTAEKFVNLSMSDGSDYTGHCGGIAAFEKNAWVVSGKYARRIELEALLSAENGATVSIADMFNTGTRASYANCSNGILWVGEYHKNGNDYVTEDSHHLTSPSGEEMAAWTVGYRLEEGNPTGFDYDGESKSIVVPDIVLETESMCQGFTQLPDGRFVTSISGSAVDSRINFYENVLESSADGIVNIEGEDVEIRYLDSTKQLSSTKALPRSEGVEVFNGKLLVLYESGCQKMLASQIVRTENIWSMDISA